ncbi:PHD domain-containing protein/Agenet domain-containing protein [Cephalotus follicularis]|uniref:PHD domain-containing protein/Agenet domain-containing protein n=1 Tax=Cephalotus follicularis TaxID=3775 RepID=A0A1Q3BEZ3_CEPFO|nr:PHD domain-containing protein/Agenet domain-containing protein [Cephalotus follicularis]
MALDIDEYDCTKKRKRKTIRCIKKLLVNEKVEVRSVEDGFLGSWHLGTVIASDKRGRRHVKYDHLLVEDESDNLVDIVGVSPTIDGIGYGISSDCSYRGRIRPLPPPLEFKKWGLPYGLCVDVNHNEAWWEGVIFDHEDGSEERKIFFPDLGDEMATGIDALRITQDWDELTEVWQRRGTWYFLELIEEYEQENYLTVSIKQIWYDVREKNGFRKIKEWTSSGRALWKKLVLEVINDNLKIIANSVLQVLGFPGSLEQETRLLDFSKPACDVNMYPEVDRGVTYAVVPVEDPVNSDVMSLMSVPPQSLLALPLNPDRVSGDDCIVNSKRCPSMNANMTEQKPKRSTRRGAGIWLPAGPDIVPGGQFCPQAVNKYMVKSNRQLQEDVRKHLIHLGWDIHYTIDRDRGIRRLRYTSPLGKCYFSLHQVCLDLMEPTAEFLSSNSQDDQRCLPVSPDDLLVLPFDQPQHNLDPGNSPLAVVSSHSDVIVVEPEYCPQAVVDWYEAGFKCKEGKFNDRDLILKAKKHLSALGWVFTYYKVRGRPGTQYRSPRGRVYYSLRRACKACLNEGVFGNDGSACRPLEITEFHSNTVPVNFPSKNRSSESSCVSQSKELVEVGRLQLRGTSKHKRKRKDNLWYAQNTVPPKSKHGKATKGLIAIKDDTGGSELTSVLRSTKRVQQVVAHRSSNQPRTVLSWLIDNDVILPREKVYYHCRKDQQPMAEGRITRKGIECSCCRKYYTLNSFEAHAGSSYHRSSANIFLEDGRSLLDCQRQLRNKMRNLKAETHDRLGSWHQGENDHICSVCHYGGELILCDQCPSSFHKGCLGLKDVPDGDWFCPSCCCHICGESKFKKHLGQSMENRVLSCHQCEHKYHLGCLQNRVPNKLEYSPTDNWFCSKSCEEVCLGLRKLLGNPLPVGVDNLTWTLMKSVQFDNPELDASDIEALTESYSKLHVALTVMHECFEPVREPCTGRDLVKDVIFSRGSELNRLNFRGFYTVLLERKEELISVATVRIYGEEVAEVPLVATRLKYRRLGMCRILMNELETKLMGLGVKRLVLPAVPSVLNTWTTSFGFSKMTDSERLQFVDYTFLDFQDTIMCQKLLLRISSAELSLSKECQPTLCDDADRSGDHIDLDGSSAVSEVFQAEQLEESGNVDQGLLETSAGDGICSCQGQIHLDDDVGDPPSHLLCEPCLRNTSPGCSVEDANSQKEKWGGNIKCYKRRNKSVCGN